MSNKTDKLSNKEKVEYSRRLAKKLLELGVEDKVLPSGTRYHKKFVDDTGRVIFEAVYQQLSNPHRNMIKKLREMPRNVVDTFLNMQAPKKE